MQFQRHVQGLLRSRLTRGAREAIVSLGVLVVADRTVTDVCPELAGQTPRGWPPGCTWEDTEGFSWGNLAVVTEFVRNEPVGQQRLLAVAAHEIGHSIDYAMGDGRVLRDAPDLVESHRRDGGLNLLGDAHDYYRQSDGAGRQELIAEAFCYFMGCRENDDIQKAFPKSMVVIQSSFKRYGIL